MIAETLDQFRIGDGHILQHVVGFPFPKLQGLRNQVTEVVIEPLFNGFDFLGRLLGERHHKVVAHHFTAVANHVIEDEATDVGAQVQHGLSRIVIEVAGMGSPCAWRLGLVDDIACVFRTIEAGIDHHLPARIVDLADDVGMDKLVVIGHHVL